MLYYLITSSKNSFEHSGITRGWKQLEHQFSQYCNCACRSVQCGDTLPYHTVLFFSGGLMLHWALLKYEENRVFDHYLTG